MDFIDFYNWGYSLTMLEIIKASYENILLFALIVYAINFIFEGIGLYTMALNVKSPYKWMAFVPFFNTYLIGKLGGDGYFFSAKLKNTGLWVVIVELISFVGSAFYFTITYLLNPFYDVTTQTYVNVNKSLEWAAMSIDYIGVIVNLLNLAYIVFLFVLLFAFFRKYYYRNPMMMAISAYFLPFTKGLIIFSLRNNKPVDYEELVRRQREEARRRYEQYQRQYRNPYEDEYRNPYTTNTQQSRPQEKGAVPPDPFEEFSSARQQKEDDDGFFH